MLDFVKDDPEVMFHSTYKEDLHKVVAENYVRLTSKSVYLYQKKEYCELTMVKERLSQDTFVVYLQKNSPYTRLFNDV